LDFYFGTPEWKVFPVLKHLSKASIQPYCLHY